MNAGAWLALVAAGAVGAPVRYLVDALVTERTDGSFPWGTLLVNATGSLILGLITGLSLYHALPATPTVVLGTGFCGAYTTFSTFTFESVHLLEDAAGEKAFFNVFSTLVICAGAAAAGVAIAAV